MIQLGPTLSPDSNKIPKSVFEWVSSRNKLFPAIDFKVDHFVVGESEREEFSETARKYSQTYSFRWKDSGVYSITFPFLAEMWVVTIVGGVSSDGTLGGKMSPDYATLKPLTPALRNEIAGFNDVQGAVTINEKVIGVPRSESDKVSGSATEFTAVTPDIWYENR